jgi:GAF domain-containing protein
VLTAARDVLNVDGTGLMLLDEAGALRVAGASDPAGVALEQTQQELGGGPGVDCVRFERTVAVHDLPGSKVYADVWAALTPLSVRAVLSVPVRVEGSIVGTLNAMASQPRDWPVETIRATEAYAAVLAVLLRLGAAAGPAAIARMLDVEE